MSVDSQAANGTNRAQRRPTEAAPECKNPDANSQHCRPASFMSVAGGTGVGPAPDGVEASTLTAAARLLVPSNRPPDSPASGDPWSQKRVQPPPPWWPAAPVVEATSRKTKRVASPRRCLSRACVRGARRETQRRGRPRRPHVLGQCRSIGGSEGERLRLERRKITRCPRLPPSVGLQAEKAKGSAPERPPRAMSQPECASIHALCGTRATNRTGTSHIFSFRRGSTTRHTRANDTRNGGARARVPAQVLEKTVWILL